MPAPDANPAPFLARFTERLTSPGAELSEGRELLAGMVQEGSAEEAFLRFRRIPKAQLPPAWIALRPELERAASALRDKRSATWHLDADRILLRLRYARGSRFSDRTPAECLAALGACLRGAGFSLALGLGKTPRPLLTLGPPLPTGTGGLGEWADAVLERRPEGAESDWLQRLGEAAPEGLAFQEATPLPAYATPVLELAREAHWRWSCPETQREEAEGRVAAFLASNRFPHEKIGKAEGQKAAKSVDLRPLVRAASWEGGALTFVMPIAPGHAFNARKLLGGILGEAPESITDLVRVRVVLAEDKRLKQAEKFEPKLRNIFEDAVVLGAGSNLTLIDEDEDEPLVLH